MKINHKTASSGFTKSPASASNTETPPASMFPRLRLRMSNHQRMRERRVGIRERRRRHARESGGRIPSARRSNLTNNESLNKSLLMLAEMTDEKETMSLGEEILSGLSEEVKMYRQGYVRENGQYIQKQFENCPVCFLQLRVFKCENKLYESYQIITHIKKCQTLKVKSEIISDDSDKSPEQNMNSDKKPFICDGDFSGLLSHPMTSVYIKEEFSIKEELCVDEN